MKSQLFSVAAALAVFACGNVCSAMDEFTITNNSDEKLWCAVMYYMPKGVYFGQSKDDGFRDVLSNKEVRWRLEGWWQINPGKTVTVYAGNQKDILLHIRNARGGYVTPKRFDRKGQYPMNLDDFFRVDSFEDEHRVEAKWRKLSSDRWNSVHYRNLGSLYKASSAKWKPGWFFEVPTDQQFTVRN